MGEYLQGGTASMTQLLLAIIYLAFISLGLPDSLLGSAWPTMYQQFGVPISYAGIISMIISAGTIVSSLQSDRLTKKLGTGKVTAISVAATAVALFGFSFSHSFWALCLWAIPYGLGAGSVDASLNNYVALHYESRHMSWLHCMWGVGATAGPYIMGIALSMGQGWNMGYRYIGIIQVVLTAVLVFSLPLWKGRKSTTENLQNAEMEQLLENVSEKADTTAEKALSLREILKIAGAKEVMLCFFCYCALEQTAGLWASSYLTLHKGVSSETAAIFASLFYIGITVGRAISGFITMKLNDTQMVRLGQSIIVLGIMAMVLPGSNVLALAGLILIGLGCAPIYPCVIHSTPAHFGADKSQAIIGVQMAFAYIGILAMPPLFGVLASRISVALLPCYLFAILVVMVIMHELLTKKTA
jgi:fucose permease